MFVSNFYLVNFTSFVVHYNDMNLKIKLDCLAKNLIKVNLLVN